MSAKRSPTRRPSASRPLPLALCLSPSASRLDLSRHASSNGGCRLLRLASSDPVPSDSESAVAALEEQQSSVDVEARITRHAHAEAMAALSAEARVRLASSHLLSPRLLTFRHRSSSFLFIFPTSSFLSIFPTSGAEHESRGARGDRDARSQPAGGGSLALLPGGMGAASFTSPPLVSSPPRALLSAPVLPLLSSSQLGQLEAASQLAQLRLAGMRGGRLVHRSPLEDGTLGGTLDASSSHAAADALAASALSAASFPLDPHAASR